MLRHDSKLDLAFLNVKHRVGDIALLEHVLILMEFQYLLSRAHFGEKAFGVKNVFVWLVHGSLLWLDEHLLFERRAAVSAGHYFRRLPPALKRLAPDCPQFYGERPTFCG